MSVATFLSGWTGLGRRTYGAIRTKTALVRAPGCCVASLLVVAQGCVAADGATSSAADNWGDSGVAELNEKATEDLSALATEELVRRVSVLPDRTVVVFDFDDTLLDHVEGEDSRWASYAQSAISHLKARGINIAVCSRNTNSNDALNRALRRLDSEFFTDAFFNSPAFQDNTGVEKWDDIQQIMAHYRVTREDHVVFFDDTQQNIDSVGAASDVITMPVEENGIDRDEFRDGMIQLLTTGPTATRFKLRNPETGLCMRRSTTQVVGTGYEVYQTSCNDTAEQIWWRDDCTGSECKFVGGDGSGYCLKASSTLKASGGSYNIYAVSCTSDSDQLWSVTDLGGSELRLQNRATGRCAYATQSEKTSQGQLQLVQRACDTTAKQRFVKVSGTVTPPPPPPTTGISHIGTTKVYDSNGQGLQIARPSGSQAGDLLVLFLHRTDDVLPLQLSGWKRVAECLKEDNNYQCATASQCTSWYNTNFCRSFGGLRGEDLAQAVFVRTVGAGEPSSYTLNMNMDSSGEPGWAILTAIRGANNTDPVRAWAGKGCDHDGDSLFPSVSGNAGDLLLLSQSNDQPVPASRFLPPSGTTSYGYVTGNDETAFLFAQKVTSTGQTGVKRTQGPGETQQGAWCKDLTMSVTIRPR